MDVGNVESAFWRQMPLNPISDNMPKRVLKDAWFVEKGMKEPLLRMRT